MNPQSSKSAASHSHPAKRVRHSSSERSSPIDRVHEGGSLDTSAAAASTLSPPLPPDNPDSGATTAHGGQAGQSSNFRNVTVCNRCRLKKNKCDQRLPSCGSCEKANLICVGFDPITRREIPRRYVLLVQLSYAADVIRLFGTNLIAMSSILKPESIIWKPYFLRMVLVSSQQLY